MKWEPRKVTLFWSKVDKSKKCWEWQAGIGSHGYGMFKIIGGVKSPMKTVHRISYALSYGVLPRNKLVLHKCDNKKCVNPKHLYLGTAQDNSKDAMERGLTSRGEDRPTAKITRSDVIKIRTIYKDTPDLIIAKMFGISCPNVSMIQSRKRWAWLK